MIKNKMNGYGIIRMATKWMQGQIKISMKGIARNWTNSGAIVVQLSGSLALCSRGDAAHEATAIAQRCAVLTAT